MGNSRIEEDTIIAPNGAAISLNGLRAKAEARAEPALAEPLSDRGIIYMQNAALDVFVRQHGERCQELESIVGVACELLGIVDRSDLTHVKDQFNELIEGKTRRNNAYHQRISALEQIASASQSAESTVYFNGLVYSKELDCMILSGESFQHPTDRRESERVVEQLAIVVAENDTLRLRLSTMFNDKNADARKRELERAREAYFEMGGIESDIGPRDDPSWYWRRAFKIARACMESAEPKLAVKP